MPKYMLLFYAEPPGTDAEAQEREAEVPLWRQLHENLSDAGLLVAADRLHDVESATTVRVRDRDTQVVDGPFAVTKEYLRGYYVLECEDLDQALKHAARVPLARYGSVEVRPVMEIPLTPQPEAEAAASA